MRSLALLRGVNVGGARMLPMAALEGAFRTAGALAAETVIQSGNVVFDAQNPEAAGLAAARAIEAEFGFRPAIIVRSAWRAMVEANPFVTAGISADTLHVACLAVAPPSESPCPLDPKAFAPDEFALTGADVYLRLPYGLAKANLTNRRLDKTFRTVSTLRNWRTVLNLLARL
jgi:uncharacterized protein (DUF1697 family)